MIFAEHFHFTTQRILQPTCIQLAGHLHCFPVTGHFIWNVLVRENTRQSKCSALVSIEVSMEEVPITVGIRELFANSIVVKSSNSKTGYIG
jgi:hypothetical protein